MGFTIIWEKAIVDKAGNIRVPMSLDLSKLKSKNGKPMPAVQAQNVFELYIKNDKGQNEVSIMQFMQFGEKYYPLRYTLAGEGKTKVNLSAKDIELLSKKGKGNKVISSNMNETKISAYTVVELLELMYGDNFVAALVYQCTQPYWFDPINCNCGPSEYIFNSSMYPELYMLILYPLGDYVIVPYPFDFHPSTITFDEEYPSGPIDPGTYDCAGVQNGTAYIDPDCGCMGGTTGITDCSAWSEDLYISATASIVKVSPSAMAIASLGNHWGWTEDESVDLEIGASRSNGVWTAVLKSVKGNYSVQARLIPGCSEVGGTDSTNYCAQVSDLKALGGSQWYMVSAVLAHENVHVTRLLPSLNNVLSDITTDVQTLTVPVTGQTKAQAIAQLKSLAAFSTVRSDARRYWDSEYMRLIENDHNGATDAAEHAVVDPVGTAICNLKKPTWPACTSCPY